MTEEDVANTDNLATLSSDCAVTSADTNSTTYDVAIVGGGMVGGMLAAALGRMSLSVALLETHPVTPFDPESQLDLRVSALSLASQRMLEAVGAWDRVSTMRACPYNKMCVWDGEEGGRTEFYSGDTGHTHLGHIVENRVLQLALTECVQSQPNVHYLCPASLLAAHRYSDKVKLVLHDDTIIWSRLLVGADGASSRVRKQCGFVHDHEAYAQKALVASIKTSLPQQSVTWQRFLPTGAQAFLPLPGAHASLVWYHSEAEIDRLMALPIAELKAVIEAEFPSCLGKVDSLVNRGSFPLHRSHARQYVKSRVALIGDAAHSVHPLAGQGVNLGLLDAAALAEIIVKSIRAGKDFGQISQLKKYERWRRFENGLMLHTLDAFFHAFSDQPRPIRHARSLFMNMVNRMHPLKNLVATYAMGVQGDLPSLAKGNLP